jgi:hypothetical protein|tara:strand:- start:2769 stop:3431 length:663 start_codon:yes stop_codon:yes gene_type:complete
MIIGVCGFIGSGKDTIADYLVNIYEFRRESFANSLKDAVAHVFGWDRTMLEGRTKQAREWRERVDPWWAERLKIPKLTPRLMLQLWGTEVCRGGFHDDIWIASLENKLRNSQDDVVISDCRFPNEIKAIKLQGGIVIRVVRGPEPEWINHAKNYMAGEHNTGCYLGKHHLDSNNIHASEYAWVNTKFDAVLDNNGTMDDLFKQINGLAIGHPVSKVSQPA